MSPAPLRIGVLGAARITPMALLTPAKAMGGDVEIAAIAARDPARAAAFAKKHRIARSHGGYEALLADEGIDAIYNPLPNSLHAEWTIRALAAGKHVLCEKPFASNAAEAEQMAAAAKKAGRVLMEAFHWRHHPLAARMIEIVRSGELGTIQHIDTRMCIPLPFFGNIRYRYDLAGGATMDTGAYAVHMLRTLAGAEPEVVKAEARLSSPNVDRWMRAEVKFADGRTGRITCSLWSSTLLDIGARVVGSAGEMRVFNPVAPQFYSRLTVRSEAGAADGKRKRRVEKVAGEPTYLCQLRAFLASVRDGAPVVTSAEDAVRNMRTIDAIYRAAGLPVRGTAVEAAASA